MKITDKLREFIEKRVWRDDYRRDNLLAIADRIDAEHERAVRYERCAFWHDASDDELANYGLLRAPIDADGVTWRIGDRDEDGREVGAIKLDVSGFWINVGGIYRPAERARHYQPDTWEKIIEDAIVSGKISSGYLEVRYTAAYKNLVKRCKELAGDAE